MQIFNLFAIFANSKIQIYEHFIQLAKTIHQH